MAAGSEKISQRWVEGAERVCVKCGAEIKNLQRDVGEVRRRYSRGKVQSTEIICTPCFMEGSERLVVIARSSPLYPNQRP